MEIRTRNQRRARLFEGNYTAVSMLVTGNKFFGGCGGQYT